MFSRRIFLALSLAAVVTPAFAASPPIFATPEGIAINGYDPVAYFTKSAAVAGNPDITLDWNGASWLFASVENREAFVGNTDKYAPQFGGYCALAASKGAIAPTDPQAWTIHNDKLYLNFSLRAREIWRRDIPENIRKAEGFWPEILY